MPVAAAVVVVVAAAKKKKKKSSIENISVALQDYQMQYLLQEDQKNIGRNILIKSYLYEEFIEE